MTVCAEALATSTGPARRPSPSVWAIALIFWAAFAAIAAATAVLFPEIHLRQDPDSFLRLVQVRDLLQGQGWLDLTQHRLDPPTGVLLHWSRLVDVPIAVLIRLGDLFGDGERFAMTVWPLLLFLAFILSVVSAAATLAGTQAAGATAILALLFIDPMLTFLPNNLDHHNAQIALTAAAFASILRMCEAARWGLLAGLICALMLAIGLEMLPYVAVYAAFVALRWALSGQQARSTLLFGSGLGVAPAFLYFLSGSPDAAWACDSLSFAYAVPALAAAFGLALAVAWTDNASRAARIAALGLAAALGAGAFLGLAPHCLTGPYGALSPELTALWLEQITEAQPVTVFAAGEPAIAIALLTPPLIAAALAALRSRPSAGPQPAGWGLAAALVGAALALSFYQVRTIPYANAIAIPALGAWIASEGVGRDSGGSRRRAAMLIAFLLALPLTYLAVGWAAVTAAASVATDGRYAPVERRGDQSKDAAELRVDVAECSDPASAELLRQLSPGLVLAPVLYGPTVLMNSSHSAVSGPYHRAGAAILDTIHAFREPPDAARRIVEARHVDYVALCATASEVRRTLEEAPAGFAGELLSGGEITWLEPVVASQRSGLRLWRVRL